MPSAPTSARRLFAAAAAATLLASTLAACGGDDSSGEADTSITVQYSWIKNEEFTGEFYAYENGYYTDEGFDEVNAISGPDTGIAKLLSNEVDIAINDSASVGAAVAEQEAPLKIVGATFQKNPFTILSLADGGNIATPEDLKGKRIGVQDSNANVFNALLAANGLTTDDVEIVPVDFDPTPLMNGDVDGFMAYVTNEELTVQLAGYETTSLPYADNGVPFVAETFTVTDQYLAENRETIKNFLTAEIKGWSDAFNESTDDSVELITQYYNEAANDSDSTEASFGALDPVKTGQALEATLELISTDETQEDGLFTISDDLQQQTIDSLANAGWDVEADQIFDTSIIDEIYEENPDLIAYQQ